MRSRAVISIAGFRRFGLRYASLLLNQEGPPQLRPARNQASKHCVTSLLASANVHVEGIMIKLIYCTTAFALTVGAFIAGAAENAAPRVPVLLELFTSEGCSS